MSLSLVGEALCGVAGAFVGVAIMGTADHYTHDSTLIPLPICPNCGLPGPIYRFVPILSPLLLYRCRECRTLGSWWLAVLVQIAMAALWATLASRYDFGWPLGSALLLTVFLGAIAVIDFQHRLIPSLLVYPTVVIAVAGSPLWPGLGLLSSVEGAAIGFALFSCWPFSRALPSERARSGRWGCDACRRNRCDLRTSPWSSLLLPWERFLVAWALYWWCWFAARQLEPSFHTDHS